MKGYNCPTSPRNLVHDLNETAKQLRAIEAVNHLTPATEAKMDNLIVPTRDETITKNSPGFEETVVQVPVVWDIESPASETERAPTDSDLIAIDREEASDCGR